MSVRLVVFLIACTLLSKYAQSQNSLLLGAEYNYYPAGNILGLQLEKPLGLTNHSLNARIAVNMSKRYDFSGLNDNEEGWGPGFSLGYRYYQHPHCSGLYAGIRTDLWYMSINWMDSSESIQTGNTKILVLQPTFELGYLFMLGKGWQLGTAFVNGVEINTITRGEEVGQGWITLWQLRISKRISLASPSE